MEANDLNAFWAGLLVEELTRNGVTRFVIAPGSRSTPLAVAAFRSPKASVMVHFDERGAAFFALGCALAGNPAAVICTSGTAVANCAPAVAEAFNSALPLVVLSADRPPELQECGANQTMEQAGLFERHVRDHLNLPCPDAAIPPQVLLARVDAVLASGLVGTPGPVHINCMFREPLAPNPDGMSWQEACPETLADWKEGTAPFTRWEKPCRSLSLAQCGELESLLAGSAKGLLMIGRLNDPLETAAAMELATMLGWPVVADITSGCRNDGRIPNLIGHYDLLLRSGKFRELCAADCVLHVGDVFVSKYLQEHLRGLNAAYVQISPRSDNRDPLHRVTRRYTLDLATLPGQLRNMIRPRPRNTWLDSLLAVDKEAGKRLHAALRTDSRLTELAVAEAVESFLSPEMALFIGNSMPVRDLDVLLRNCPSPVIRANRGVSGIDGNLATAAGMKWNLPGGVAVLIGDMAALHDLNSLALLSKVDGPMVVMVVNNQGGGIFSFLPIARHGDVLDPCFTNPHSWQFDHAAAMFGLDYVRVDTWGALEEALQSASDGRSSRLIEIAVDREYNVRSHQRIYNEIARDMDAFLGDA